MKINAIKNNNISNALIAHFSDISKQSKTLPILFEKALRAMIPFDRRLLLSQLKECQVTLLAKEETQDFLLKISSSTAEFNFLLDGQQASQLKGEIAQLSTYKNEKHPPPSLPPSLPSARIPTTVFGGSTLLGGLAAVVLGYTAGGIGLAVVGAGVLGYSWLSSPAFVPVTKLAPPSDQINRVTGIRNRGNTCFLNATFQLIMNDEGWLQCLVKTYAQAMREAEQRAATNTAQYRAYQGFFKAVKAYQKGDCDEIDLTPLRPILYDATAENTQGDAYEAFLALLGPVKEQEYPHLYFRTHINRHFQLFEPGWFDFKTKAKLKAELKEKRFKIERKPGYAGGDWKDHLEELPQDGTRRCAFNTAHSFSISLDQDVETNGSKLINREFQARKFPAQNSLHSVAVYRQNGDAQWYYPDEEQVVLDTLPDRFMIQLKRFNPLSHAKDERRVEMPEELTLTPPEFAAQKYRLKTMVIHGDGHYWALVKKGHHPWKIANDSTISTPDKEQFNYALNQGYIYFYEKA